MNPGFWGVLWPPCYVRPTSIHRTYPKPHPSSGWWVVEVVTELFVPHNFIFIIVYFQCLKHRKIYNLDSFVNKSLIWQHSYHCLPSHNQNISEILRWQCGWGVTINVNSSGIIEDCKSFNKSILSNYVVNGLIHSYEQISVIIRKPKSLDECILIWCTSNGKW